MTAGRTMAANISDTKVETIKAVFAETGKYDLTPMQTVDGVSQQVPDPCNEPLASSVEWGLVDRAVAAVVGNGFSATVTRLTATPPIVIRVEFKGVFLEKVIL